MSLAELRPLLAVRVELVEQDPRIFGTRSLFFGLQSIPKHPKLEGLASRRSFGGGDASSISVALVGGDTEPLKAAALQLGRIAAMEILLNTPLIQDLIFKGEVGQIKEIMAKSTRLGMQTFDQALSDLFEGHAISFEDALRNADSANDLRLQIKLNSQRARSTDLAAGTEHFAIV